MEIRELFAKGPIPATHELVDQLLLPIQADRPLTYKLAQLLLETTTGGEAFAELIKPPRIWVGEEPKPRIRITATPEARTNNDYILTFSTELGIAVMPEQLEKYRIAMPKKTKLDLTSPSSYDFISWETTEEKWAAENPSIGSIKVIDTLRYLDPEFRRQPFSLAEGFKPWTFFKGSKLWTDEVREKAKELGVYPV